VFRWLCRWPWLTGAIFFFVIAQLIPPFLWYIRTPLIIALPFVLVLILGRIKQHYRMIDLLNGYSDAVTLEAAIGETLDPNLWMAANGNYEKYLQLKALRKNAASEGRPEKLPSSEGP
jgi:hypothetical protein